MTEGKQSQLLVLGLRLEFDKKNYFEFDNEQERLRSDKLEQYDSVF